MLKPFVPLAMVFLFFCGCAKTMQTAETKEAFYKESSYEKLAKMPYPFAVFYDKDGKEMFFEPGEQVEKYENLQILLMEPGLVVVFDKVASNSGMEKAVEDFFHENNFNLVERKTKKFGENTYIIMNFARNGKLVIFK